MRRWPVAVITAACAALLAARPAMAQYQTEVGGEARFPLRVTDAAGANGQPLIQTVNRSNIPFLRVDDWNLRLGGHVEGSYTYNFDPFTRAFQGQNINNLTFFDVPAQNFLHEFDAKPEDPTLNQADLFLVRGIDESWRKFDVGGKIEGMWGADAAFIHSNGMFDSYQKEHVSVFHGHGADRHRVPPFEITNPNGGPENQFDVPQAYLDIAVPVGNGARIRVGKVASPYGLETIDPTTNLFMSRGFMRQIVLPDTETGAWAAYHLNQSYTVEVGVHRGWDQSLEDDNSAHSYMGRVQWLSNDQRTVAALVVDAGPPNPDDSRNWRITVDLVGALMLNPEGARVGGEALYGSQDDAVPSAHSTFKAGNWVAASVYAAAPLNRFATAKFRAELVDDPQGALGFATTIYSVTGGFDLYPLPTNRYGAGLVVRPELRWDIADSKLFPEAPTGRTNNQWIFGIDLVYAF